MKASDRACTKPRRPSCPTPVPVPVQWKSVVGLGGFFGQTFDDQSWAGRSIAPVALYSVACADNTHGWASGQGGYVAYTEDGGQTWAVQSSHLASDLRAINFGWSTRGVVAGDGGALAVTQDGGASTFAGKARKPPPDDHYSHACCFDV